MAGFVSYLLLEERAQTLHTVNAELERVNRIKDEFLSTGSHELRTPLNVILGTTEILQGGIYGPLNPKQAYAIEQIQAKDRQLLHIFQDMLDLSRMQLGHLHFTLELIFLKELCLVELDRLNHQVQAKYLHVEFVFNENVRTTQADEVQLSRIVHHLCDNAIKFTPEGGRIGIEVRGERARTQVHLSVWDLMTVDFY